jgi:hypothetical protein
MSEPRHPLIDPTLAHQIGLRYVKPHFDIQVFCNCGWTGSTASPVTPGAMEQQRAEYREHADAARDKQ